MENFINIAWMIWLKLKVNQLGFRIQCMGNLKKLTLKQHMVSVMGELEIHVFFCNEPL